MSKKKALIVEDDSAIADVVKYHLSNIGLDCQWVTSGLNAVDIATDEDLAIVVLDLNLPDIDGLEVCKKIRETKKDLPLIMLTAKIEELDVILGLEVGADDYMKKPFSPRELIARAKALLRRNELKEQTQTRDKGELDFGRLKIELDNRRVFVEGVEQDFTAIEYDLLVLLAKNPGRTFERNQLLQQVWGYDIDGYDATINSHINRIRKKVEIDQANPDYVQTVWGVGYRFKPNS